VIDLQRPNLDRIYGVQSDACNAAALAAIGSTAENTRLDTRFKISRIVCRHLRKKAFPRSAWGFPEGAHDPFIYIELWVPAAENRELPYELLPIFNGQHFTALLPDLRAILLAQMRCTSGRALQNCRYSSR
jgi:hypothetical protein